MSSIDAINDMLVSTVGDDGNGLRSEATVKSGFIDIFQQEKTLLGKRDVHPPGKITYILSELQSNFIIKCSIA